MSWFGSALARLTRILQSTKSTRPSSHSYMHGLCMRATNLLLSASLFLALMLSQSGDDPTTSSESLGCRPRSSSASPPGGVPRFRPSAHFNPTPSLNFYSTEIYNPFITSLSESSSPGLFNQSQTPAPSSNHHDIVTPPNVARVTLRSFENCSITGVPPFSPAETLVCDLETPTSTRSFTSYGTPRLSPASSLESSAFKVGSENTRPFSLEWVMELYNESRLRTRIAEDTATIELQCPVCDKWVSSSQIAPPNAQIYGLKKYFHNLIPHFTSKKCRESRAKGPTISLLIILLPWKLSPDSRHQSKQVKAEARRDGASERVYLSLIRDCQVQSRPVPQTCEPSRSLVHPSLIRKLEFMWAQMYLISSLLRVILLSYPYSWLIIPYNVF